MDRDGARLVLAAAKAISDRLKLIWADMGYRGQALKEWIERECGWELEVVK
jgi:transposase